MIYRVEGSGDPRVADYRHVADSRWLLEHGLFVAESRLVVERLLAPSSRFQPISILATPTAAEKLQDAVGDLSGRCDLFVCEQGELDDIGGHHFHRGCLALAARSAEALPDDFAGARTLLALERIGNPDNIGGVFRAAAAFGAGGVLLDPASGDPLYRKAIRTSMGAILRVPFARLDAWPSGLDALRSLGFKVVALTPAAGAQPLHEFARERGASDHVILVAGAEGTGLTEDALAYSDVRVAIPIDRGVDSLNVSVAVSIALYALR